MIQRTVQFILLFTLCSLSSFAQYTQVGEGGFASSFYGPLSSDTSTPFYSRYAYIYNANTINKVTDGDNITALAFKHNAFDTLDGNCVFKIYLKTTPNLDFGAGGLNWLAETRNGMTLVYEGNPSGTIGDKPGWVVFKFNKVDSFHFDTSGRAENFQILTEFRQNANQVAAIPWFVETAFYVPTFLTNNETKYVRGSGVSGYDSITNASTIIKPTIRIYHPRSDNDLRTYRIYSLGKNPVLMNKPDSIKTIVQNVGSESVTNHDIYLKVGGANQFLDTLTVDSIAPYEQKLVAFTSYKPINRGTDSISVTIAKDSNSSNNIISKQNNVNYNVYSHVDPFTSNNGGIGFNGTTGDFVAKFYVQGSSYINQISVDFTVPGRDFQLGVWDDDGAGGSPGTLLFISDSLQTVGGTYILSVLPRVKITEGFYIGIRQTGTTNVGFGFQYERPIREHTFYFTAPAGDTVWTPFAPGFDFNFNIQPRLQVANDLAVLNFVSPQDNDSILYSSTDSLEMSANIINYGFLNQNFYSATLEVKDRFGQPYSSSQRTISTRAGDTTTVYFDKFSMFNIGEFSATVTANLNIDSVSDNNSATISFFMIKDRDVAVDIIYEPNNNDSFELQKEGFWPTVRVFNYGVKTQSNFPVTAELLDRNGNIVFSQTQMVTLTPEDGEILTYDSIFLFDDGRHTFRAYSQLFADSFPGNDSMQVYIYGKKTHDVMMLNVIRPQEDSKFVKNSNFRPFINYRNDGLLDEDSTVFYASIEDADGSLLYTDTSIFKTSFFSTGQVLFRQFECDSVGEYVFKTRCYIEEDQLRKNDSLSSNFSIVTGKDLRLLEILKPTGTITANGDSIQPEIVIRNNGLNKADDALITMSISDQNLNVIYLDSIQVSLEAFTEDTFKLTKYVVFNSLNNSFVTAINEWDEELERNNLDTIRGTYVTRFTKDLELVYHSFPEMGDTLDLNQLVTPRFQVLNVGLDTLKDIQIEVIISGFQSAYKLWDTVILDVLSPNRAHNFTANKIWEAELGEYSLVTNNLLLDDNRENDEIVTPFYVVLRNDIAIDSVLYPTTGTRLVVDRKYKPVVAISNKAIQNAKNVIVRCQASVTQGIIYTDEQILDLDAGASATVSFDSTLTYNDLGEAKLVFSVQLQEDQRSFNDTLISVVEFVDGSNVTDLILEHSVKVYPNPATSVLNIAADNSIKTIEVVDQQGKMIFKESYKYTNQVLLDVSSFATGVYTIKMVVDSKILTQQFIKE